jgi:hypothetical protein
VAHQVAQAVAHQVAQAVVQEVALVVTRASVAPLTALVIVVRLKILKFKCV